MVNPLASLQCSPDSLQSISKSDGLRPLGQTSHIKTTETSLPLRSLISCGNLNFNCCKMIKIQFCHRQFKSVLTLQGFESQHNQAYWAGKQYIGIGPGMVYLTFADDCSFFVQFFFQQKVTWILKFNNLIKSLTSLMEQWQSAQYNCKRLFLSLAMSPQRHV